MKKKFDNNKLDIALAMLFLIAIALCVHSCKKCNDRLTVLQEQRLNQVPNIQIN